MRVDDESRKKLERFWRRKLWLGLAAVGAIGLAAWRVAAVQGRYDDVLVQESQELPEKVYQELVAEVRKGVPILPNHAPGTDFSKSDLRATRCDSILALGFLKDSRAIPELGRLLDDDMSRSKSCYTRLIYHRNRQENSVYVAAVSALFQFQEPEASNYFKKLTTKAPSPQLLTVWRDFYRREYEISRILPSNKDIIKYDMQPLPDFESSPKISLDDKEELFKIYVQNILDLQISAFPVKLRNQNNESNLQEFVIKRLSKNITFPASSSEKDTIEDAFTIERLRLPGVRKKIIAMFDNSNSSPPLFLIRYNLSRLVLGDEYLSNLLFDLLIVDLKKGRSIDMNAYKVLPPQQSFNYGETRIKELSKLSLNADSTISNNAKFALDLIGKKLREDGKSDLYLFMKSALKTGTTNTNENINILLGRELGQCLPYLISALGNPDSGMYRAAMNGLTNLPDVNMFTEAVVSNSIKDLSNKNLQSKQIAIYCINYLIAKDIVADHRIAPSIVSSLKSLNQINALPLEVSPQNPIPIRWHDLNNKYYFIEDTLVALEALVDRGQINDSDRKNALPVLMSIYKNWDVLHDYRPRQDDTSYLMTSMEKFGGSRPSVVPHRFQVVRLIRKLNESEKVDRTAQQRTQQLFYLETGVLGAIGVTAIGLLLSSIRLRNPFSLFFSTYLLFPEEVVAELIALKQRRQSEKVRKWQIRLELAYEIITLIWAFQIQIRIDDRKLPPGGNRSAK